RPPRRMAGTLGTGGHAFAVVARDVPDPRRRTRPARQSRPWRPGMTDLLVHRPQGIGHPYTPSPEQRYPVLPGDGQMVRLGVVAREEVGSVVCELVTDDGTGARPPAWLAPAWLPLAPATPDERDLAALAGGEGHLAGAQAAATAAAGGGGGWE